MNSCLKCLPSPLWPTLLFLATLTAVASLASIRSEPLADPPPGYSLEWGLPGHGPERFFGPIQLAVDSEGKVYAADSDGIQVFDKDGRLLNSWECEPFAMCVARSGTVFVIRQQGGSGAIHGDGTLETIQENAFFLQEFSPEGRLLAESRLPAAAFQMSAGPLGDLYLMEWGRVVRLGRDRQVKAEYPLPGDVFPDKARTLHVKDNGELSVLLSDGRVLRWDAFGLSLPRLQLEMLGSPDTTALLDMAVAPDSTIYACDTRFHVMKFGSDGRRLTWWGSPGHGPGEFGETVYSVAINDRGDVYVADHANYRIQRFTPGAVTPSYSEHEPRIFLHLTAVTRKNICSSTLPDDCTQFQTSGECTDEGQTFTAYVLVDKGWLLELGFLEFGLSYGGGRSGASNDRHGIDIVNWRSCATQRIPSSDSTTARRSAKDGSLRQPVPMVPTGWTAWPEPGSFMDLSWGAGTTPLEGPIVACVLEIAAYSPDTLWITASPRAGSCRVSGAIYHYSQTRTELAVDPERIGRIVFSTAATAPGYNPCDAK